jgi:phospholipid N-methyltransferase
MIKSTRFLNQFIKNKKSIGAVLPSSYFLQKKILAKIDFTKDLNIVEFGPGTGAFTFEILKKLSPKSNLFVFEINEYFHQKLENKIKDNRVTFINDSAENLAIFLKKINLENVDIIISSLPIANFSDELRKSILQKSYDSLLKDGKYIQYQYSKNALEEIKAIYKDANVTTEFVFINIPPAWVYECKK